MLNEVDILSRLDIERKRDNMTNEMYYETISNYVLDNIKYISYKKDGILIRDYKDNEPNCLFLGAIAGICAQLLKIPLYIEGNYRKSKRILKSFNKNIIKYNKKHYGINLCKLNCSYVSHINIDSEYDLIPLYQLNYNTIIELCNHLGIFDYFIKKDNYNKDTIYFDIKKTLIKNYISNNTIVVYNPKEETDEETENNISTINANPNCNVLYLFKLDDNIEEINKKYYTHIYKSANTPHASEDFNNNIFYLNDERIEEYCYKDVYILGKYDKDIEEFVKLIKSHNALIGDE